jgi:hypothetical protein
MFTVGRRSTTVVWQALQKEGSMATTGTGTPSAIRPIEDQTGADVIVRSGLPAEGQDLGAAASTSGAARAEEAQMAQEKGAAEFRDEETRKRADVKARRSSHTLEDIAADEEKLRVFRERRSAEEEEEQEAREATAASRR